jgi:hypothetical protein
MRKFIPIFAFASVAAFRNVLFPALGLPTQPITISAAIRKVSSAAERFSGPLRKLSDPASKRILSQMNRESRVQRLISIAQAC